MSTKDRIIRVVVIGDAATGKSSLIVACATESFPDKAPPVLPPARLPAEMFPEGYPLTIIDTSARKEDEPQLMAEVKTADVVVLTFACDKPSTVDSLSKRWLPLLQDLQICVPIIVVGCRLDLRTASHPSLEASLSPIMNQYRQIETCLECSSLQYVQVPEVFLYAQRAVAHPLAPLFDPASQRLRPRCVRALSRIFRLCDKDGDSVLSDKELNAFQVQCFAAPLQPSELKGVKRVVAEKLPQGVASPPGGSGSGSGAGGGGLTLPGFLYLHALFIEKGRLETTWAVLRSFGYSDSLELRADLLPRGLTSREADQSVELTEKGVEFLRALFLAHDQDQDGELNPSELEALFATAPSNPFLEEPYLGACKLTPAGAITLDSFLALWSMMSAVQAERCAAHLQYGGQSLDECTASLRVCRRRRVDRHKGHSARLAPRCLLLGPRGAGKSALLDALLDRQITEGLNPTLTEKWAVASVGGGSPTGSGRVSPSDPAFLVVQEVPEDRLAKVLLAPDGTAPYDCAAFVYDSASLDSWERCVGLLENFASSAEASGSQVPCLLVAAKDDLPPHPAIFPLAAKACPELGVPPPIPVSALQSDTSALWSQLARAAALPNKNLPETAAARSQKAMRRMLLQTAAVAAGGSTLAVVAIVAYRMYLHRRQQ